MDPREQCCHNRDCWAYGRRGEGHIRIHSLQERRYRCERCGQTFSATKGTALYRAHKPPEAVEQVVTLLAHGCPVQAIVAAFGWDERTVARYQAEAGAHCQRVHEHVVQAGQVELGQVQADELRVRVVGGVVWLATALAVPSRLWLGGVVGAHRDRGLIRALLARVRACGPTQRVLLCVEGLSSYVSQARHVFRQAVRTGQAGRPRLVLPAGVLLAQAVKRYAQRRVVGVARRVVWGTTAAVQARLAAPPGTRRRHQHRLHRAAQRDLPRPPGRAGAAHSRGGAAGRHAGGGHVAGRHLLQLLLAAGQPAAAAACRRPPGRHLGRAHAGPGGGPDRSLLVGP